MPEHNEQPNSKYSPEYQAMLDAIPGYLKKHEIPEKRFQFWEGEAKKRLNICGNKFEFFTPGDGTLIETGNTLLMRKKSTGYNVLLNDDDMDIGSSEPLLFYNCHIGRVWHFGLLLAEMENKKLIVPKQVKMGQKATKVLYDGVAWIPVPEDEFVDVLDNLDKVVKTVETVVTFSPENDSHAIRIAEFLVDKTDANRAGHIPGSWYVQDIRGTLALETLLEFPEFSSKFGLVTSNIVHQNSASIIALRAESSINDKDWDSFKTIQDVELIRYLTEFGVLR